MNYKTTAARLDDYRRQIADLRRKMREEQAAGEPGVVKDYTFRRVGGAIKLSELFGDKVTLIVVHNMGTSLPNCTRWAAGVNGGLAHVSDRAGVVVSSPDPPEQ